jgi:hypothetical protein
MTRVYARVLGLTVVAMLVIGPATAGAAHKAHRYPDTPTGALNDCNAGHYPLKGHYTIKVLQQALKRLGPGTLQYTNCADVLTKTIDKLELAARHKAAGGSAHPRGSATRGRRTGKAASAAKQKLHKLKAEGSSPILLPATGQTATPGTVTNRGASFLSNLPTPLLIVLAVLLATVLAVSARAINTFVRARRTH